ncbi:unnamed protein product [Lampetra fluviatilis]
MLATCQGGWARALELLRVVGEMTRRCMATVGHTSVVLSHRCRRLPERPEQQQQEEEELGDEVGRDRLKFHLRTDTDKFDPRQEVTGQTQPLGLSAAPRGSLCAHVAGDPAGCDTSTRYTGAPAPSAQRVSMNSRAECAERARQRRAGPRVYSRRARRASSTCPTITPSSSLQPTRPYPLSVVIATTVTCEPQRHTHRQPAVQNSSRATSTRALGCADEAQAPVGAPREEVSADHCHGVVMDALSGDAA